MKFEFYVELFLIWSIILMGLICLIFLVITFIKRYLRIKKNGRKIEIQSRIEAILFPMLHDVITVDVSVQLFKELSPDLLINKLTIRSIVSLHQSYSGESKRKLEEFYRYSGLMDYSIQKLNSKRREFTIEGIRDLSILNIEESAASLNNLLCHKNLLVRKEALIGLIALQGIEALMGENQVNDTLDDWTQGNIIYNLMNRPNNDFNAIEDLLMSKNESLVLLGLRLVEIFQLNMKAAIRNLDFESFTNEKIKIKANNIVLRLISTENI